MVAMLLGGLAFFLYGMSAMSDGLEKMAGGGLERTLRKVTKNQFLGFVLGAGITIAIQSSSAMTVMLVGLVNSGIVAFADSFGIIMGSNVGTTLTAWMLSLAGIDGDNFFLTLLQPMTFAPILAFVGIVMRMLSKKDKQKHIGMILIGFAVLMSGMDMMSASMKSVQEMKGFQSLLTSFDIPIVALLTSVVFTGIIQSSAATVGIVQALAITGAISYKMAIPLVLGANIGTCITALISSFGTNKNAKRVVAMHIYVNVIGSVLCMIALYAVDIFNPSVITAPISMVGVAIVHTIFNTANTVILIPFRKLLIKLCELTVRSGKVKEHTVFLDERLFNNVPLAISECRRLTVEMADFSRTAIRTAISLIEKYNDGVAQTVEELESLTDKYEDKLGTYLVRLSNNALSDEDSHAIARLLHSIGDFERIGDHALNIRDIAVEIHQKKIVFSENATNELKVLTDAICEILDLSVDSFINDDPVTAAHVEPLEQIIDKLRDELKSRHVERLQNGECTIQLGFVFSDLLTNYERVADHCSNVAVYTIQLHSSKLDAHKYLSKVTRHPDEGFISDYNSYAEKYALTQG